MGTAVLSDVAPPDNPPLLTGGLASLDRPERSRVLRPGPLARLHARVRAGELDRALARGADPSSSAALAHRAAQLTSPAHRRDLADGLERVLTLARAGRHGAPRGRFRVLPARAAVLDNRAELRELAETLRAPGPLYARGLALLSALLADGTGPVYARAPSAELARRLEAVRRALLG